MKRLGILSPTFPPDICGIGDFTAHMVKRLLKKTEIDISVISRLRESSLPPTFPTGEGAFSFFPVIRDFRQRLFENLAEVINEKKFDCLWIQFNRSLYEASLAFNLLPRTLKRNFPNLGIIATIHDFPLPFRQLDPLFYFSSIFFLRHCDRVVFTNECDHNKFLSRVFSPAHGSSVIPSGPNILAEEGVSPKDYRSRLGLKPQEKLVLYFGMLRPDKSLFSLLRAVEFLRAGSVPVHLALVGKDPGGKYSRYLQEFIKEPGKEEYIHLLKELPSPEVSALLQQADLVVLPYSDGVTEKRGSFAAAVTHGSNIVTTKSKGTSPMISGNPSIIFSKSLGVSDLADAMEQGLVSPPGGGEVKAKRMELNEFFGWDHIAEQYLQVFDKLR